MTGTAAPGTLSGVRRRWRASRWSVGRRALSSWQFVIPALLLFIGWQLYPILRVAQMSFTDYRYLVLEHDTQWVGLQNYVQALQDPLVQQGLLRATLFTALFLPGMIGLPLLAAVLIDKVRHGRLQKTYRLLLLLPAMIPAALVFILWKWMYSFTIGPINWVLVDVLGVVTLQDAPRWIGDPMLMFPSMTFMEWWWGLGLHTLFFVAGLRTVPKDLPEAARVDGASEWQVFRYVLLPRLRPMMLVLVVLRFGSAMALVDEHMIFGGTNRALPTYTWTLYMWDTAFQVGDWNQGYAAAVGWIGTFAMLVVVGALFYVFRPKD